MATTGSYVGSAWNKEGKRGPYISVSIDLKKLLKEFGLEIEEETRCNLFMFTNERKKSDTSPDYSIMYLPPRDKNA